MVKKDDDSTQDGDDRVRYASDAEAYGQDLTTFTTVEKRVWAEQERFLNAFAGKGTKSTTAVRIGMSYDTVKYWARNNLLNFNERLESAQETFNAVLEDKALELALGLKPGQNVTPLAILMNGNMPEKYKHNVIQVDSTSKDVMTELQRLRAEAKSSQTPESNDTGRRLDITRKA